MHPPLKLVHDQARDDLVGLASTAQALSVSVSARAEGFAARVRKAASLDLVSEGLAVGESFSFGVSPGGVGGASAVSAQLRRIETDELACVAAKVVLARRLEVLCASLLPAFDFAAAEEQRADREGHVYSFQPPSVSVRDGRWRGALLGPQGCLATALSRIAALIPLRFEAGFELRVLSEEERAALAHWLAIAPGHEPNRDLAAAWLLSGRGLRVQATLETIHPLDAPTLHMFRACLFGAHTQLRSVAAHADRVDLGDAWPVGIGWPRLRPSMDCILLGRVKPRVAEPSLIIGRDPLGSPIGLSAADRARHVYVVGATGTGKSTLLGRMIEADAEAGNGLVLIDPHGDLARAAKTRLPAARREDLVWCDVTDARTALGIDLLTGCGGDRAVEREFVINELIALLRDVLYAGVPEAFGPAFELYFRNTLLLLLEGSPQPNLTDFVRVLTEASFRSQLLARCVDGAVTQFWRRVAADASGEQSLENFTPYIACKLAQFTGNAITRRMLDPKAAPLDLRSAMDQRRIVLITLEKGAVGGFNAAFLGALISMRLVLAAMGSPRGCCDCCIR